MNIEAKSRLVTAARPVSKNEVARALDRVEQFAADIRKSIKDEPATLGAQSASFVVNNMNNIATVAKSVAS